MATQLNQLLGILTGLKGRAQSKIDRAYHLVKRPVFDGLSRTYQPLADDGEKLPPESVIVRERVMPLLRALVNDWSRLMDVSASVDATNGDAFAPIRIAGREITPPLHGTTLIYTEKQLVNLRTLVESAPVLDPAKGPWTFDEASNDYVTEPVQTSRSKKVPRAIVLHPGTDKHPPQVKAYDEDVLVGYWTKVERSGALPAQYKQDMLDRIDSLVEAVRVAREEANRTDVTDVTYAKPLFDYVLEG